MRAKYSPFCAILLLHFLKLIAEAQDSINVLEVNQHYLETKTIDNGKTLLIRETTLSASYSLDTSFTSSRVGILDFMNKSLLLLFRCYQVFVSDIDGSNCPMEPTCSNYAIQSIRKNGLFYGTIKSFDRLHRCSHDLKYYPTILINGRLAKEDLP